MKTYALGYHGCDRTLGERLIARELPFAPGTEAYHWLGAGVYFWEDDPLRALEWAKEKQTRGRCESPFVVGAVIDMERCLDLHLRENLLLLKEAYKTFVEERNRLELKIPENRAAKRDSRDTKVLRYLDHAVIEALIKLSKDVGVNFDSVRGTFSEGAGVYPGRGILELTHSQIAVRDVSRIKGVFAAL